MPRIIAIGDIHGYSAALGAILDSLAPAADDTLVTLGDYVDRGPDCQGVIDALIDRSKKCHLIPIFGNHEEMLLGRRRPACRQPIWLELGGQARRSSRMAELAARSISSPTGTFRRAFWPSCLPRLSRNRHPSAAARQLRSGSPFGRARSGDDSLAIAARFGSWPPLLGQDGDRRVTRRPDRARFSTSAISNASTPIATAAAG